MNTAMVASLVRIIVVSLGSMAAARGIISEEQATYMGDSAFITGIIGALSVLAAGFSALWSRRKSAMVATVAKLPEVISVATTEKMATKVDAISATAGAKVQTK